MDRTMRRGDTLFFLAQVFRDPITSQYVSAPQNMPPPGYVPADITAFKVWFTAKYNVVDQDPQAVSQLDNQLLGGVVVSNATTGQYNVTMPPLVTRNFPDGDVVLVYDVQIEDASMRIFTVESGTLTVVPDVTRAIS